MIFAQSLINNEDINKASQNKEGEYAHGIKQRQKLNAITEGPFYLL